MAHAFSATTDFAIDKAAGVPCPNLGDDDRCTIHDELGERGFPGCAAYDCFGAGQHITQVTFRGRHWRDEPDGGAAVFAAFGVMRELCDHLWHLREALRMAGAEPVHAELRRAATDVEALIDSDAAALAARDRAALRPRVNELLQRASEHVRGGTPPGRDFTNKVLIGHDFRGADLRRAAFGGACLVGSDFSGADLTDADLCGADLRGIDVTGVDLSRCLFLAPAQLAAAATPLVPLPKRR